jgi:hypothetical protein
MHIILAHGSLGDWDEIIFISVAFIFLVMMGISWVKSRATTPELDDSATTASTDSPDEKPGHFRLD